MEFDSIVYIDEQTKPVAKMRRCVVFPYWNETHLRSRIDFLESRGEDSSQERMALSALTSAMSPADQAVEMVNGSD